MVMGRWFRGAHAARVRARAARPRELSFSWPLSFGSILPEIRFGEPPTGTDASGDRNIGL